MASRRFVPLIVAVVLGALALLVRMFDVQVLEHSIWAGEAANLVRSGAIRPYTRGSILDAQGRVLRSDKSTYRIDFVYRDFRRRHPVGVVAHARSALIGETVTLADALASLETWADELCELTPAALDAFARGEALQLGSTTIAGVDEPGADERRARRADVRFYVLALFELSKLDARAVAKLALASPERTWAEIVATTRRVSVEDVRARLAARLRESRADLDALADALERESDAPSRSASPLEGLIATLERHRERVEDESASALFREATGFSAHRIEASALSESVDLTWIRARMNWTESRLLAWLERGRADYRRAITDRAADRIAAELEIDSRLDDAPDRVLESWAAPFALQDPRASEEHWTDWTRLSVLDELDRAFQSTGERSSQEPPPVLPFQTPAALVPTPGAPANWDSVARAELGASAASEELAASARAWSDAFEGRFDRKFVRAQTSALLARWDQTLQTALREALWALRGGPSGDGAAPKLVLREEGLDRANEKARFVLRDYGNRPRAVLRHPSYAMTYLLTRHRDRFAGFVVQDTHERVPRLGSDGAPIAAGLIGSVGTPTIQEELLAEDLRRNFHSLARKGVRAESESEELMWLAQLMTRPDELRGRSGVEAYLDAELAGRNGYRESRGIQDLIDGSYELDVPPVDGLDVTLTLDLDVQQAALESLASPAGDPDPEKCDYTWLAKPTGAIVLMRVDGSVVAAASYPTESRNPPGENAPADAAYERTLRKPSFQPPGSCFKPFVAAWALDHLRPFDPMQTIECKMLPDNKGSGYVDVRCNSYWGHDAVDMRKAIAVSCNSYFAMVGEQFSMEDWRDLAAEFGFGRETGVRSMGRRPGLFEDTFPSLFQRELVGRSNRLAGNGLAVVEATPMQLARAAAGLATGVLPEARLIDRIGDTELPRRSRELSISRPSLAFVRDAMDACANEGGGSARPALNERELGWRMAAKTGSGDIGVETVVTADGRSKVRKHTWVIGWFPSHAPRFVVVVYCHDTLQTASHSAIWLTRQFLQRAEVRALMAEEEARR